MLQTITSSESYIFLAVFVVLALVALIYLLSPMSPPEPLLYLIGVNHPVQFKDWKAQLFDEPAERQTKREAFRAHVTEMIDTLNIEILAEEFSEETKRKSQAIEFLKTFGETAEQFNWETEFAQFNWETVLEQLSKAKGIEHRFCDPDSEERKALGIEKSDWDKREQVWLLRIEDCKGRRVLFVCGDNHYDAFVRRLESNGFQVRRGPHYDISNEEFDDPERTSSDA